MLVSEAFAIYDTDVLLAQNKSDSARRNCKTALNKFVRHVGDVRVEFLGKDHVLQWKLMMREEGLKPSSINDILKYLRGVLKYLSENEWKVLDWHKIEFERVDQNRKVEWLTPAEVQQLLDAADNPRDRALIGAYFGTGCRLSELLSLDRSDITEAKEIVTDTGVIYEVWVEGKNHKYRPVYIDRLVKAALDTYLDGREDRLKPLFVTRQNRRMHPKTVIDIIHRTTRRSGLEKHVTTHTLRHSYVSDLAMNNAPLPAISKLVGHSKISTTLDIYTHILDTQQQAAFGKYHTQLRH
jgi:integrase/recombinase XerD